MTIRNFYLLMVVLLLCRCTASDKESKTDKGHDWPFYGGNKAGNRYSPLDQININNVKDLEVAWTYNTGENNDTTERGREIQCQPIIVDGVMYGTTPKLKAFAVKADDGKFLWKFDPFENKEVSYHTNRGVMYWGSGDDKRILYTAGSFLYALDAKTGKPIKDFGDNGKTDLHQGLSDNLGHDVSELSVTATSPGVIYKNILIIGSRVSENGDSAPGHIRAFNVVTGKLEWVFHTIPQPGEFGYQTWPKDAYKRFGGANNWGGMVLDEKRGVVYFGTGSPSVDFYGGAREGQNLFANCVLALDAKTGKRKWHYQTIHHDLWDRDIPCPPNLITVKHNGKMIDAVAQTTKDGLIFVLDRDSGKPLFPVEERKVPTKGLPGEHPWPTQPVPVKPAPLGRQYFTEQDITELSKESHDFILKRFRETKSGDKYIPPSKEGTIVFGIGGGPEWGGNAADPQGILYQNSNDVPWDLRMNDVSLASDDASKGKALFLANCAACHGADRKGGGNVYPSLLNIGKRLKKNEIANVLKTGRGRMPSFSYISEKDRGTIVQYLLEDEGKQKKKAEDDFHTVKVKAPADNKQFPYMPPYVNNGYTQLEDLEGYPGVKPPWSTLNAIDLNTGEYLWRVPLGEYDELKKRGIPPTGTETHAGPIVTAGGLVFIAATQDEKIRAFDKKTGKIVWEYKLPAGGFATPATYEVNGKQYIVIAAGGTKYGMKPGSSYIAFSLKNK